MSCANIYTKAKISLNSNLTTDDEPVHTIEFDGVIADIVGNEPTKREIEFFKIGILYERERIWDESANLVDIEVMRKLLKEKKEICKSCGQSSWIEELLESTKPVYMDNELIGYHTEWLCPKCRKQFYNNNISNN